MPLVTEPPPLLPLPPGATDHRHSSVGSLTCVGLAEIRRQPGQKGKVWLATCDCGALSTHTGQRWQRALDNTQPLRCPACKGHGKARPVSVSDHAVLRYCQRVLGVDMDGIRNAMLSGATRKTLGQLGPGTYTVDGEHGPFEVVVTDGTVVTVLPRD